MTTERPVERAIERKVREALSPEHLEVVNESHMHNVPPGSETHFRLFVVAEAFAGQRLVQRQQAVYRAVTDELAGPVHALAMETLSPDEWTPERQPSTSPPCLGGDGGKD